MPQMLWWRRPISVSLMRLVLLASVTSMEGQNARGDVPAYAIDPARYLDSQQYSFLERTIQGADVVSLGESIHLTHEFPLVRIGMVRFLNEHVGFHLLALEGSAVDVWATQDRLLDSPRFDADLQAAQQGLFGIWNTPEMRRLFEYEVSSWKSSTPLYIAAYDIQPGTGAGTSGVEAFRLLAERLRKYAAVPPGFDQDSWIGGLRPLTGACSGYRPNQDAAIEQAIGVLEEWIARAIPEVERRYSTLPHAAVLRLIPDNLRASLQLCREVRWQDGGTWARYKSTRDTNAASYALKLKAASETQKLMVWAHISHVFYDSAHQNISVGELLHRSLGRRLYTLGVFAEGGATILLFSDVNDQIGYAPVYGAFGQLRQKINKVCPGDCFLDLRDTNDALFLTPHFVWFEGFPHLMSLAKDFDGVVWIKHVHAPEMPLGRFLALATLVYRKPPMVYAPIGFVVFALVLVALWRRRRRIRRARRTNLATA